MDGWTENDLDRKGNGYRKKKLTQCTYEELIVLGSNRFAGTGERIGKVPV